MSKIVKNTTGSDIQIIDTGETIPANGQITINPTDNSSWASSDDVIAYLNDTTPTPSLVVNDGNNDLEPAAGISYLQGGFPTQVGIVGDVAISPTVGTSDSFGRHRVSEIRNIFESTMAISSNDDFWDTALVGSGTSTHNTQSSDLTLAVGTGATDKVTRQTFSYFHYAAGQSMLIRMTGILGAGATGVNTRIGYFNNDNGILFDTKDGVFRVVIRTDVSGSVVDNETTQANFNIDKLDGSGPSGKTIDLDTTHIFEISYQWLGVGTVSWGVHIDGAYILLHREHHSNTMTSVYMRTPHLPVRYEIEKTAVTAGTFDMKQICTQVANEGIPISGDDLRSISTGVTTRAISSSAMKPMISIRIKAGNEGANILIETIKLLATTQDDILIQLYIGATLTGSSWTDAPGLTQQDVASTAMSGGKLLYSDYANKEGGSLSGELISKLRPGFAIDGTPQHITVGAQSVSSSANALAAINYKELF